MTDTAFSGDVLDVDKPAKGDDKYWSVTTVIDVLEKKGLMYWSAEMTANAAIDSQHTWLSMLDERGRDEAVTWLRDAMNRRPKTTLAAADLGTTVHKCCEALALDQTRPNDEFIRGVIARYASKTTDVDAELATVNAMLTQFDRWCQQHTPTFELSEIAVYSDTFGYAGTLDSIMSVDRTRYLTDYKTSRESYDRRGELRTPYPEQVGLQIAAYRYAELAPVGRARRFKDQWSRRYYLLNDDERARCVPVPDVDTGLVIHLTPEHCHAYPIDADAAVFDSFLHCLECFRWVKQESRHVMREAL